MIAWIIGLITLILLLFIGWRSASKSFRERCEEPKFLFLESLGIPPPVDRHSPQRFFTQENNDDPNHS